MPVPAPNGSVTVHGIPDDVPERVAAIARSRMFQAHQDIAAHTRRGEPVLVVGPGGTVPSTSGEVVSTRDRAGRYTAEAPRFGFDQLVLPAKLRDALFTAVEAIRLRDKIYDQWGLRRIEPAPSTALNLHGPPGTGKTLAAHAIAARLGMGIMLAGYAELESKFHGDGPKNIKAAFHAAEQSGALLFIDEADSLLSRRLTNVTQGSEQAINSMRSQIVLCLDAFAGVVVFSTNLVSNYDSAFGSRVRHFRFELPDEQTRAQIWRTLLVPALPLAREVDLAGLTTATEGFSGREIKLVIIAAAERVAIAGRERLTQQDFLAAIEHTKASREETAPPAAPAVTSVRPPTPAEREAIEAQVA